MTKTRNLSTKSANASKVTVVSAGAGQSWHSGGPTSVLRLVGPGQMSFPPIGFGLWGQTQSCSPAPIQYLKSGQMSQATRAHRLFLPEAVTLTTRSTISV